jgi:anti-anti-sigma regulatory factor
MKRKALEFPKNVAGEQTKAILYIDEELSFINGSEIRNEIIEKIGQFELLIIQANLVHIDLTGVQLLYSIQKTLQKNNKKLTLNVKMADDLKSLVTKAGFIELVA